MFYFKYCCQLTFCFNLLNLFRIVTSVTSAASAISLCVTLESVSIDARYTAADAMPIGSLPAVSPTAFASSRNFIAIRSTF